MTMRGWAGAVLAALALTLAVAGCGGGEGGERGGGANGPAARGGSASNFEEGLLAYASCMRKHGVDVPDPQPGERGFAITPDGPPTGENGRRFREADEQCRSHLRNVRPPELSDEEKEALREALLKHVRCMREQGIDLPDPSFEEGGGTAIPLGTFDPHDPDFQKAQKACEKHLRELDRQFGGATP